MGWGSRHGRAWGAARRRTSSNAVAPAWVEAFIAWLAEMIRKYFGGR